MLGGTHNGHSIEQKLRLAPSFCLANFGNLGRQGSWMKVSGKSMVYFSLLTQYSAVATFVRNQIRNSVLQPVSVTRSNQPAAALSPFQSFAAYGILNQTNARTHASSRVFDMPPKTETGRARLQADSNLTRHHQPPRFKKLLHYNNDFDIDKMCLRNWSALRNQLHLLHAFRKSNFEIETQSETFLSTAISLRKCLGALALHFNQQEEVFLLKFVDVFQFEIIYQKEMSRLNCFLLQLLGGGDSKQTRT